MITFGPLHEVRVDQLDTKTIRLCPPVCSPPEALVEMAKVDGSLAMIPTHAYLEYEDQKYVVLGHDDIDRRQKSETVWISRVDENGCDHVECDQAQFEDVHIVMLMKYFLDTKQLKPLPGHRRPFWEQCVDPVEVNTNCFESNVTLDDDVDPDGLESLASVCRFDWIMRLVNSGGMSVEKAARLVAVAICSDKIAEDVECLQTSIWFGQPKALGQLRRSLEGVTSLDDQQYEDLLSQMDRPIDFSFLERG